MGRERDQAGPGSSEDLWWKRVTVPLQRRPSQTLSLCLRDLYKTHPAEVWWFGAESTSPNPASVFWVGKGVHKIARFLFASERHKDAKILVKSLFLFTVQGFSIHRLILKLLCTDTFGNNQLTLAHINPWMISQAAKVFRINICPMCSADHLFEQRICSVGSASAVLKHLINLKWGHQQ